MLGRNTEFGIIETDTVVEGRCIWGAGFGGEQGHVISLNLLWRQSVTELNMATNFLTFLP